MSLSLVRSWTTALRHRAREPELLDQGVSPLETERNLADLRRANLWLAGRCHLLRAVRPHVPPGGSFLDVGCGSADITAFLHSRLDGPVRAVGLDLKIAHVRAAPASVRCVAGDVRALPFPDGSFDVVAASLFLHHFDGHEVASVLGSLYRLARRALVVSDLHRATVPLVFGRLAFPLIFRSRVSVHDGLVSIRRGFRPPELRAAFEEAGIPHVQVRRHFPYRLLAVARRAGKPS